MHTSRMHTDTCTNLQAERRVTTLMLQRSLTPSPPSPPPFCTQAPFLSANPPLLHITRVNQPSAQANGTVICLTLQPPCPTLLNLCPTGECPYAIFNARGSKNLCCPVNYMASNALAEESPSK